MYFPWFWNKYDMRQIFYWVKDNQLPLGSINNRNFLICQTKCRVKTIPTKRIGIGKNLQTNHPMTADLTTICSFWYMIIVLINVQNFASHIIYKEKQQMVNSLWKISNLSFWKKKKVTLKCRKWELKQEGILSNLSMLYLVSFLQNKSSFQVES